MTDLGSMQRGAAVGGVKDTAAGVVGGGDTSRTSGYANNANGWLAFRHTMPEADAPVRAAAELIGDGDTAPEASPSQSLKAVEVNSLKTLHALEREVLTQQRQAVETRRQMDRVLQAMKHNEEQVDAAYQAQATAAQTLLQHREDVHAARCHISAMEARSCCSQGCYCCCCYY